MPSRTTSTTKNRKSGVKPVRNSEPDAIPLMRRSPANFVPWTQRLSLLELDGEDRAYTPHGPQCSPHFAEERSSEDATIARALAIIDSRLRKPGAALTSPGAVRDYLRLSIATRDYEVFCVLYLDSQNRLLACDELFRGTIAQTSVYPREVCRYALLHNAAAVIFAHNHPSGSAEPSRADEALTAALKAALAQMDIRTLDHLVVGGSRVTSFAERGLL